MPQWTANRNLSATNRRHDHLRTPAGAAVNLRTGTEGEILGQANSHLAQIAPVAGHGHVLRRKLFVGLEERCLDFGRGRRLVVVQTNVLRRECEILSRAARNTEK